MQVNWTSLILGIMIIIVAFVPGLQRFESLLVLGILIAIAAFFPPSPVRDKSKKVAFSKDIYEIFSLSRFPASLGCGGNGNRWCF